MTRFQVLDRADRVEDDVEPTDPDPLAALSTAGLGWLVEHVGFLREPLDWLAGHVDVLDDAAATWQQVGTTLGGIARQRAGGGAAPDRAPEAVGGRLTGGIAAMSRVCLQVASHVAAARTTVAAIHGVLRDLVAMFVSEVLRNATVALASSEVSLGTSVAAFAAWAAGRGAVVLDRITGQLVKLVRVVAKALSGLKALFGKARDMLAAITRYGDGGAEGGQRTFGRQTGHLDE